MSNNLYMGPDSQSSAFTNKYTHPVTLVALVMNKLKARFLGWEADTLWDEIRRTWVQPSSANKTKIQASRTCLTATSPFEYWNAFEIVGNGLSGLPPTPNMMQRLSPWKIGFAVSAMGHLRNDFKIESEVWKYIAACLHDAGYAYAPGKLGTCNKYLAKLTDLKLHHAVKKYYADKKFDITNRTATALHIMKARQLQDYIDNWELQLQLQMQKLLGT